MSSNLKQKIKETLNLKRETDTATMALLDNSIKQEIKEKNTQKVIGTRNITQFRVSIPKKFADAVNITSENKNEYVMKFFLYNSGTIKEPKYELTAKLQRKK